MKLSEAVKGFLLEMRAGNYSENTIELYGYCLTSVIDYLQDPQLDTITTEHLQRYMAYMRHDYTPRNAKRGDRLAGSSLDNRWKAIRTFYRWAERVVDAPRPDEQLQRPKYSDAEIIPYDEDEVKRILDASQHSYAFKRYNTKEYRIKRRNHQRNYAIMLTLLDTGARVGEISRLEIQDVDLETGEVIIGSYGTGKKTRPRVAIIGKATRRAIWVYLTRERKDYEKDELLFDVSSKAIQLLLLSIGRATGIQHCNPHRFRHTFAIEFLRNGGNVFELQEILGHSTLDMCRRYAKIAKSDIKNAHRKASPVDRWKL